MHANWLEHQDRHDHPKKLALRPVVRCRLPWVRSMLMMIPMTSWRNCWPILVHYQGHWEQQVLQTMGQQRILAYIYRFSLAINTKKQHDTTVCFVLISFDQRLCQILLETTKVVQFQPRGRWYNHDNYKGAFNTRSWGQHGLFCSTGTFGWPSQQPSQVSSQQEVAARSHGTSTSAPVGNGFVCSCFCCFVWGILIKSYITYHISALH